MLEQLEELQRAGAVGEIDVALARLLARLDGGAGDEVALAACLASSAVAEGDVCANLRRVAGTTPFRAPAGFEGKLQDPNVGLGCERGLRLGRRLGCDHDLDELLNDGLGR